MSWYQMKVTGMAWTPQEPRVLDRAAGYHSLEAALGKLVGLVEGISETSCGRFSNGLLEAVAVQLGVVHYESWTAFKHFALGLGERYQTMTAHEMVRLALGNSLPGRSTPPASPGSPQTS